MVSRKRTPKAANIKAKKATILAYFQHLRQGLDRAATLLEQQDFLFEAILVVICHIGTYARLRFPRPYPDSKSYKQIVLEYSGQRRLYEKIDLLFLYQWRKSDVSDDKRYKKFKNYSDVKGILEVHFGDENVIRQKQRFVTQDIIIKRVRSARLPGLDMNNVKSSLQLFSVAEQLYLYMRCPAVHTMRFPFWDRQGRGNHPLTRDKYTLLRTARSILRNLKKECLRKAKFPFQLP